MSLLSVNKGLLLCKQWISANANCWKVMNILIVLWESLSNITILIRSEILETRSGAPILSNCICREWMMMNNEFMISHERQMWEKEPYDIIITLWFGILFRNFTKAHSVGETKVGLLHEERETYSHHSTCRNLETSFPVKSMRLTFLTV